MDALILTLMLWIHSITGYAVPQVPPKVVYVTAAQMSALYCPNQKVSDACKIGGLYIWGTNKVYVNSEQSAQGRRAVLVHELTHYMQSRNHEFGGNDCVSKMHRELEAYAVEKKFAMINSPEIGSRIKPPPEINLKLCTKVK